MKPPVAFLQALGKLVTSVGLYPEKHPARREAVQEAFDALELLLAESGRAEFSFFEDKVIFGNRPLEELGKWPWSARLSEVGVQRLELREGTTSEELDRLATALALELGLVASKMEDAAQASLAGAKAERHPHILYGRLDVHVADPEMPGEGRVRATPLDLREEAEALEYLHRVAAERQEVPEAETAAIVGSLLVAIRSARDLVAPLIQLRETDDYHTTHCLNVALLAMSMAEYMRLADPDVSAIGEAALLHDIGKTRVPSGLLDKQGRLTEQERAVIEHHAVDGSRMLLRTDRRNPLSAVVAYEHHMHWNGKGGYPGPTPGHEPHRFSRLVHVCDVFDALMIRRPWRPAFGPEAALEFLESRAGSEFDPEMVETFVSMVRLWDPPLVPRADGEPPPGDGREAEGGTGNGDPADLSRRAESSERGFDADTEGELFPD